ncbi:MAG: PDZ domain-containing protein [Deltaproteobacteria bacterium]|nr:PDZ domain-containing protein [Deltaproteobacteria bacterium]
MKKYQIFLCLLLILICLLDVAVAFPQERRALSVADIEELLRAGVSQRRVAELIEERGINFGVTTEVRERLKVAGADLPVLQAVEKAAAEYVKREVEEEKRRVEAERQRLDEERRKFEEERRKGEEERQKLEEEKRKIEEAKRKEEEKRKAEAEARRKAEEEKKKREEAKDSLGLVVQTITREIAKNLGLEGVPEGVIVTSVEPGSPGDEAGLRRQDVVLEVNRKRVRTVSDYRKFVAEAGKSRGVLFLVRRGEHTLFLAIKPL